MLKDFQSIHHARQRGGHGCRYHHRRAFGAIITHWWQCGYAAIGLASVVDFANLLVVLKQGSPVGPYDTVAAAQAAGAVTINYGTFINTVISFIIVAAVVFFLIVRPIGENERRQKASWQRLLLQLRRPKNARSAYSDSRESHAVPNCTSQLTK